MELKQPIFSDRLKRREIRKGRVRKAAAIAGALALGAFGAGHIDKSGTLREYGPTTEAKPLIDGDLRIASWNMHNKTQNKIKAIKSLVKKEGLDVIALQEVNSEDAEELHRKFGDWHIEYALADSKQEFQDGGFGNILMTKQVPKDVTVKPIDGTSTVETAKGIVTGFIKDTPRFVTHIINEDRAEACQNHTQQADISQKISSCAEKQPAFKDAVAGWQEQRAAEAITIKTRVGNELTDARIITGHISGNQSVHDQQLKEWMHFIKDNTKENRIAIVCGDFNDEPEKIIPGFAEQLGYYVPLTGPTSSTSESTIDYCGFYTGGLEGVGLVKVIKKLKTDHHPIIGSLAIAEDE